MLKMLHLTTSIVEKSNKYNLHKSNGVLCEHVKFLLCSVAPFICFKEYEMKDKSQ